MKNKKSFMWLIALVLAFVFGAILPSETNAQTKKPKKKVAIKRKVVAKKKTTTLRARPARSPSNTFKISDRDSDDGNERSKMDGGPTLVPPKDGTNQNTSIPIGPISGGVVNGKSRSLVQPSYPLAAKAVGAKGQVSVQVLIDEDGNVISATAISGHPLLKAAAADAARRSKFSPTLLQGQPVKVSGIIIYNFQ